MDKRPAAPATVGYFVTTRPLPKGTLARDEDFTVRQICRIISWLGRSSKHLTPRPGFPGLWLQVRRCRQRHYAGILRPRDRGFLASVLAPDSRAISLKVDEETGVSGLIRPATTSLTSC